MLVKHGRILHLPPGESSETFKTENKESHSPDLREKKPQKCWIRSCCIYKQMNKAQILVTCIQLGISVNVISAQTQEDSAWS